MRFLNQAVPNFGNTVLAIMHIRAKISVRGRRGVPLDGFTVQPALPLPPKLSPQEHPTPIPAFTNRLATRLK
jgi:hypothetical protein